MNDRRKFTLALAILAALFVLACFAPGCSKQGGTPAQALATSRVLTQLSVAQAVAGAITGDVAYSEVSSTALPGLYEEFRAEIFRKGVTKWDPRFDCNHFATYFVSLAQTRFYLANFHSRTSAQSLAVGSFWYHSARGPHAIVVAITERGPVFIEPQTGNELFLTPAQRASAFLVAF